MTKLIVDHDFETYCDIDVRRVGAYKYSQHPSCDVLVLTWGIDPENLTTWEPHKQPKMPAALRALAEDPDVMFQAHNAEFEFCIWRYVMVRRYGAPKVPIERFQCTAARAAAAGLPRALDRVGSALRLDITKDKEGTRLLNKFAKPQAARKPTKKNPDGVPSRRILPTDEPEEFQKLVSYNITDVLSEMQVAEHTPPLSKREQGYFSLAMLMNYRGIPIDMKAVRAAMPVLTELENRVIAKVVKLTGGVRPTQRDKMMEFLNGTGLDLENLQAKTIKDMLLLKRATLTDKQVQLLQLRVEGGKASTKKLKKILEVVCDDGRVRGAFLFNGASTGRFAGKLIQPQNFTRGEYKPWEMEVLFALLYMSDPEVMEMLYEWPIDAIAQGMRGFIYTILQFYVSDFSAIEARMLAWLADETEVLKIYAANGDVYIRMACKLYHLEEQQMLQWCKVDEDPKRLLQRKFAKDIVLGSLGPETIVVTDSGPKYIIDVMPTDRVWDGIEWVENSGAIYTGHKEVIELCGITLTPDHKVFTTSNEHCQAVELKRNASHVQLALDLAASSSPDILSASAAGLESTCVSATAANTLHRTLVGLSEVVYSGVLRAWGHTYLKNVGTGIGEFASKSAAFTARIGLLKKHAEGTLVYVSPAGASMKTADGSSIAIRVGLPQDVGTALPFGRGLQSPAPSTPICTFAFQTCTSDAAQSDGTPTNKASRYASTGGTSEPSLPTASDCRAIGQDLTTWNLTGLMGQMTTDPATVDSLPNKSTLRTSDVFDLLECGPRHRFTILTEAGPLIVHNCGYQMGGEGFYNNCIERGIVVELEECKRAVKVYRSENPKTVQFWYDTERCAIQAVKQQRTKANPITLRKLKFYMEAIEGYEWLVIQLPSGRPLRYPEPQVRKVERFGELRDQLSFRSDFKGRWIRETTYGGKLVENITQAVSRDVMMEAWLRAEEAGYKIVGTVHDELIAENDPFFGKDNELDDLMRIRPKWCSDAPINAEGWAGRRYRK